jgi:ABC-type uncharacterized transport system permease subunit
VSRTFFSLAFHAYTLGAFAYVAYLVRPLRPLAWTARISTALGLALQGLALLWLLKAQHGLLQGPGQGIAAVAFLVLCIYLAVDFAYGVPVMGAFLAPLALAVWAPGLVWQRAASPLQAGQPLLPLHISIALLGVAAFAVAAGVGAVYLVMERQMKGKQFGLLFARLPSLQTLDDLNRRLVLAGFIALSLTLVTGAFFARAPPVWAWQSKEVGAVIAWIVFAAVLNARIFAGWRGRRVAWLTMAGFCIVLGCLFSSYGLHLGFGGVR